MVQACLQLFLLGSWCWLSGRRKVSCVTPLPGWPAYAESSAQISSARGQACRGLTAAIDPADLRALLLRQRHNGRAEAAAVQAPAVVDHLSVEPVDMEEDTATAFQADSPPSALQQGLGPGTLPILT